MQIGWREPRPVARRLTTSPVVQCSERRLVEFSICWRLVFNFHSRRELQRASVHAEIEMSSGKSIYSCSAFMQISRKCSKFDSTINAEINSTSNTEIGASSLTIVAFFHLQRRTVQLKENLDLWWRLPLMDFLNRNLFFTTFVHSSSIGLRLRISIHSQ